jgi:putative ABC transport system permease protein
VKNPLRFASLTVLGLQSARRNLSVAAVLAGVVAVTSFGLAAAPRVVNQASDDALAIAAEAASSAQRNVSFNRLGRIAAAGPDDPFGRVVEQGDDLAASLDGELGAAIGGSTFAITSPAFVVGPYPVEAAAPYRYFWFRYQEDAWDEAVVVQGRVPAASGNVTTPLAECTDGEPPEDVPPDFCEEFELPMFETALTEATADWLDVEVGDRVLIWPFQNSANNRGLPQSALDFQFLLDVTGIVDLGDPAEDAWGVDNLLHEPVVIPGALEGYDVLAMGLLAPADYDRLVDETLPARLGYDWRYFVDYGAVDSSNAEQIADDVASLRLSYESGGAVEAPTMTTGIDDIVAQFRSQRALAVTYTSLAVVGLFGLTVAVMIVLAALAANRREANTILVRSRGAGSWQLALGRFLEGIVLFVPASLLGLAGAAWLVEGSPSSSPVTGAVAVALVFSAVFTLLALPTLAGDLGRLATGRPGRAGAIRRIVIEVILLLLAGASVVLLRRRGIEDVSATGFDPLLAAAPLLVSLGAGVILLRVAPYAARLAAAIGGRARGIVGLIGFRSLARRPFAAQLPAVVMLIGAGVAVFGSILTATVSATQVAGSWQTVGANYLIEPAVEDARISPLLTLDGVPEVEATSDAVLLRAQVQDEGSNIGNIQLLAADLGDYGQVTDGTPADIELPRNMLVERRPEDAGTESNPIPVVISRNWPIAGPRAGEMYTMVVELRPIVVVVEEVRDQFPGVPLGQSFAIMERQQLGNANDSIDISPNRRYVRAPDEVSDELRSDLESQFRSVNLTSRPDVLGSIRDTPTVGTVEMISRASLALAAALSVIAVIAGFALTSRERTRDFGYLRAVGLTRRQMTWVTFSEQIPPATLATLAGVAVGIGVAFLLAPSLDLSPLTGTALDLGPTIDWVPIWGLAAILLGTVVAAAAIYSYLNREMDLAAILRRGDRK